MGSDNPIEVGISATSTTQGSPTTASYEAVFVKAGEPILSFETVKLYASIGNDAPVNLPTTANLSEAIVYTTGNAAVATVDAAGALTLVGAGTTDITATSGTASASYEITVIDPRKAGLSQIGNGDFENWQSVSSSNHAPDNWNSFETNEGSLASTARGVAVAQSSEHRPGSNGRYSAVIWCRSVWSVPAQGNITLGCINAGTASASGANNYNYSKVSDASKSETLSSRPDSIVFWAKFKPKSVIAEHPNARMSVALHDNTAYRENSLASANTEANKASVVAAAELNFPQTDGEWERFSVALDYTGRNEDVKFILVNFSTNADPGQGTVGDSLYIDDVELIYNETAAVYHEEENIVIGAAESEPQMVDVEVTDFENGSVMLSLKNFVLGEGVSATPVGTITIENLDVTPGKTRTFSYDGAVTIAAGDDAGVSSPWIGPSLGSVPLTLKGQMTSEYFEAVANIDLGGQKTDVYIGCRYVKKNISFSAEYATTCLPMEVEVPAGVTAYTLGGVADGVVKLTDGGSVLSAGKPYILYDETRGSYNVEGLQSLHFGVVAPETGTGTAYLQGVFEDTMAPAGSYVLQKVEDVLAFYLVADESQPTVRANHCYLMSSEGNVKAFRFSGTTGIAETKAADAEKAVIYDLGGRRVEKATKGIYIINGKKVKF